MRCGEGVVSLVVMSPRLKQQSCSPNPFHLLTPSQQVRRDLPAQERRFVGENQLERSLLFTRDQLRGDLLGTHVCTPSLPSGHPKQRASIAHVCQIAQEKAGQRGGAVSGRLKMKHLVFQASLKWKSGAPKATPVTWGKVK